MGISKPRFLGDQAFFVSVSVLLAFYLILPSFLFLLLYWNQASWIWRMWYFTIFVYNSLIGLMDLYFLQGWASDAPGKRHWFPPCAHNPVGGSQQAWQAFGHLGGGGKGNAKWAHLLPFCLVEKLESRLRNEKLVVSKYNDLEGSTICPCTCLWIFLAKELVGQWVRIEISLFSLLYSHPL